MPPRTRTAEPEAKALTPEEALAAARAALTAPFSEDDLERKPQPVNQGDKDKGRCEDGSRYSADGYYCGGWHVRSVHLTYVGHAGITMRLNNVDPEWTWEPMALTPAGTPLFSDGGLWIRLTVLGQTRLGFGDPGKSTGANGTKEVIGDALRNAAMRFGVGTYLWSKSVTAQILQAGGDPDAEHQPAQPRNEARPSAAQQRQAQPPNEDPPARPSQGEKAARFRAEYEAAPPQVQSVVRDRWPATWTHPDSMDEGQAAAALNLLGNVFVEWNDRQVKDQPPGKPGQPQYPAGVPDHDMDPEPPTGRGDEPPF